MNEDDLMPGDGTWFGGVPQEPLEQRIDRKRERAETLQSKAEIKKVVEHLEERIQERDRISTIGVDITEDPELHHKRCLVNAMIAKELIKEKQLLEGLLQTHIK